MDILKGEYYHRVGAVLVDALVLGEKLWETKLLCLLREAHASAQEMVNQVVIRVE